MKFCPYCGATLVGGAASFCAECGKVLPSTTKHSEPSRSAPPQSTKSRKPPPRGKKPAVGGRNHGRPTPVLSKPHPAGRRISPARPTDAPTLPRKPKPDPRDEGYDGYYNDVKPIDNGHIRDRTDPALIKRIVIVAAGAFVMVIFAVILMYLL